MKIYVIDLETTGLMGAPYDQILQFGVASLDLKSGEVVKELDRTVYYTRWMAEKYEERFHEIPWIFREGHLTIEQCEKGEPLGQIYLDFMNLINNKLITSYNTKFDIDKFLNRQPYNIKSHAKCLFDIADLATEYIKSELYPLRSSVDLKCVEGKVAKQLLENPERRVRMFDAYRLLCPDDPAGVERDGIITQTHNAADDALQEAYILKAVLMEGYDD